MSDPRHCRVAQAVAYATGLPQRKRLAHNLLDAPEPGYALSSSTPRWLDLAEHRASTAQLLAGPGKCGNDRCSNYGRAGRKIAVSPLDSTYAANESQKKESRP